MATGLPPSRGDRLPCPQVFIHTEPQIVLCSSLLQVELQAAHTVLQQREGDMVKKEAELSSKAGQDALPLVVLSRVLVQATANKHVHSNCLTYGHRLMKEIAGNP